jgi:hypothetical protein
MKQPSQRDLDLTADYQAGALTVAAVAAKYGLSVGRMYVVVAQTLAATGQRRFVRYRSPYTPHAFAMTREERDLYLRGELTALDVARRHGTDHTRVERYLRALGLPTPSAIRRRESLRLYREAYEAYAARGDKSVREVAAELGLTKGHFHYRVSAYRRRFKIPAWAVVKMREEAVARSRGKAS